VTVNVAEVKAAIAAAVQEVTDCQQAVQLANEKLEAAQQNLSIAVEGSAHDAVDTARAALFQASQDLESCLANTIGAVEQAQTYVATL
jgi:uncharacterized protein YukE